MIESCRSKQYLNLKVFCPLLIFIILILSAVVVFGASLVAATLVQDEEDQEMGAYSRQAAGEAKSEKELAQGKFLVADRRLLDPNFHKTVVLLIRYGPDGAMGLVINRPLKIKLSNVLPHIKGLDRRKETLYLGGPVEPARISLLVRSASLPEASMLVFDDVYLSSSQEVLERMIKTPVEEERFRLYAGYAGWASGQLESEYDSGHWHVVKADIATLFDKKYSEIWQELIDRVAVKWVRTIDSGKILDQSYHREPVRRTISKIE